MLELWHLATPFLGVFVACALATPALTIRQQAIQGLPTSHIEAFKPYTYYASAGYCPPNTTFPWSCGGNCEANSAFQPVASGGDGAFTQWWYVGYDPNLKTIIVTHQGTNPRQLPAIITDFDALLVPPIPSLYPGLDFPILIHIGFAIEQAKTAADVLSAVKTAMQKHQASHITTVGHSLGAALSLLDAVYLSVQLPPNVTIATIGYGLPRAGNQAFADFVDASNITVTHINNKQDPVPTLPAEVFGFVHPSGELHIEGNHTWLACPGQDNPSPDCIVGAVPNQLAANLSDHSGPYNGIIMGCIQPPFRKNP